MTCAVCKWESWLCENFKMVAYALFHMYIPRIQNCSWTGGRWCYL